MFSYLNLWWTFWERVCCLSGSVKAAYQTSAAVTLHRARPHGDLESSSASLDWDSRLREKSYCVCMYRNSLPSSSQLLACQYCVSFCLLCYYCTGWDCLSSACMLAPDGEAVKVFLMLSLSSLLWTMLFPFNWAFNAVLLLIVCLRAAHTTCCCVLCLSLLVCCVVCRPWNSLCKLLLLFHDWVPKVLL